MLSSPVVSCPSHCRIIIFKVTLNQERIIFADRLEVLQRPFSSQILTAVKIILNISKGGPFAALNHAVWPFMPVVVMSMRRTGPRLRMFLEIVHHCKQCI